MIWTFALKSYDLFHLPTNVWFYLNIHGIFESGRESFETQFLVGLVERLELENVIEG
jgi:hypothetical protein